MSGRDDPVSRLRPGHKVVPEVEIILNHGESASRVRAIAQKVTVLDSEAALVGEYGPAITAGFVLDELIEPHGLSVPVVQKRDSPAVTARRITAEEVCLQSHRVGIIEVDGPSSIGVILDKPAAGDRWRLITGKDGSTGAVGGIVREARIGEI